MKRSERNLPQNLAAIVVKILKTKIMIKECLIKTIDDGESDVRLVKLVLEEIVKIAFIVKT